MGVINESFYPSRMIHVASNDLLKSKQRGNANPEPYFFRISVETPTRPGPLLLPNSNNAFSTFETVN
jgi:hypothetical protein